MGPGPSSASPMPRGTGGGRGRCSASRVVAVWRAGAQRSALVMHCRSSSAKRRGDVWHKASVLRCLPLVVPIGLSPLLILTLCGPERVLVVSTEPPDDLSCLTTPGVGRPRDEAVAWRRGVRAQQGDWDDGLCRRRGGGWGSFEELSAFRAPTSDDHYRQRGGGGAGYPSLII